MSKKRPIVYYWIAQYEDGTALPQYDPYNFNINNFDDIEKDKLVRFGIYPFTEELSKGLRDHGVESVAIPILPRYEINLNNNKRIIYYRDVYIQQETYHKCEKCGKEFFVKGDNTKYINGKYKTPICHHCGAHDYFKCKQCGHEFTFEESHIGLCPKCDGDKEHIKITSNRYSREKRWTKYILGYQTTIKGHNHKVLIQVDENGNSEIE